MATEEAPKLAAVSGRDGPGCHVKRHQMYALQIEGTTEDSVTYVIDKEDHTLGNALRHVLMRQPQTEFCGYSVPHPSDKRMNIRLQTLNGAPAHEVMQTALSQLAEGCDEISNALDQALTQFDTANSQAASS
eukprot:gb/GECG01003264.1/.p1 GENE.gb/GECG01003264.1/~~gb/GECG01003264.1/.p1  ORF type:complete len:132 (+),score=13.88 gb/GECG01003264.1/:1-396(+)